MTTPPPTIPQSDRQRRGEGGHIEAVRITRLLSPKSRKQPAALSFAGKPVNKRGMARGVHVEFVDDGTQLPLPALDPRTRQVNLFFLKSEFHTVHALLTSPMKRLCYYWRSGDGSNHRAWLVTSSI